jgi:hypothetical protein
MLADGLHDDKSPKTNCHPYTSSDIWSLTAGLFGAID